MTRRAKGSVRQRLEDVVAVEVFRAEVASWAKRIGVHPREIHVRPMRRKWASCSTRGRLTFDAELLRLPSAERDHVVVHELVHLKVPNHGKLFRALVRAHLGSELTASALGRTGSGIESGEGLSQNPAMRLRS